MLTGNWCGNLKEGGCMEDRSVDGRILLKLLSKEYIWGGGGAGDWSGSEQGQVAGCCEHGTETSGCIKCGEFLD
jgi:hypothetical protein